MNSSASVWHHLVCGGEDKVPLTQESLEVFMFHWIIVQMFLCKES